ncbi:DUF3006 domain-containing protein [Sporosarcina sp. FA9]|uniref:DUF3006 domain-containing protein n=1 Tax=Sporosarcina sp. FA9 TaxID=3413030 RepID=UPI003F657965
MHSVYLDRFTDNNMALLLIEEFKKEILIDKSQLPEGSIVGTWFLVEIQNDLITKITIDSSKTKLMEQEIGNRMERLKSTKKSRFKRN